MTFNFTTKERNEIYIMAKNLFIENKNIFGMCGRLSRAIYIIYGKHLSCSDLPALFPEFGALKPKNLPYNKVYWWKYNNRWIRIKKFNLIIEQTKS